MERISTMAELGSVKVMGNSLYEIRKIRLDSPQKVNPSREAVDSDLKMSISRESLLNGIIMAEVLGKPRCLRPERR